MNGVICSIECTWGADGKIIATITAGSHKDELTNTLRVFAPSIPMLVGHQLGTFTPVNGLFLTKQLIDYVLTKESKIVTINSALQRARIEVLYDGQRVFMQYHPQTKLLASSQNTEEGSRQFVNNYSMYVFEKQPFYSLISVKIFLGLVLKDYFDLLMRQISLGKLGPSSLVWNSEIATYMALRQ